MHITPESLKEMAASNVAAYKNDGTSLNDSITKVAMDVEMNSDQVKRLVETTNQMAYLSELDGTDDRTFEFDVANYDSVMDGIIASPAIEKSASVATTSPMDLVSSTFAPIEKVAMENKATLEKWGKGQKLQALKKVAAQQRTILDELVGAEHDTLVKLAQHRAIVSRDPEALEKMAQFDHQLEMTRMVFGHDKIASDVRKVWADSELVHVKALSDRLTMVKEASAKIADIKPKVEMAESMIKEAFVGAALSSVGNAVKSKIPNAVKSMGKAKPMQKAKKAYGTFDAIDSTNEVRKNTVRKHDAWSSLRG